MYGLRLDLRSFRAIKPVINTLMYIAIYIFASAETLKNFFRAPPNPHASAGLGR